MVSIGIQNEARFHSAPLPRKKQKTKTIILMDAAIQTGNLLLYCFIIYYFISYHISKDCLLTLWCSDSTGS